MNRFLHSFGLALADLFRPRMLAFVLLPVLGFLLLLGLVSWRWWDDAQGGLQQWLSGVGWVAALQAWLMQDGGQAAWIGQLLATVLTVVIAMLLLSLLMLVLVVLASALLAPVLASDVARRRFPALARQGDATVLRSVSWSLRALAKALLMLLVSVPFWVVPGVHMLAPPLIWGWLNSRVMSFDALSEFASHEELQQLLRTQRRVLLGMGVVAALLGAAPAVVWVSGVVFAALFVVLMPLAVVIYMAVLVFTALWFAHFGLACLQDMRAAAARASTPAPTFSSAPASASRSTAVSR